MTLRSDLRENRWLRAQFAVLIFAAAYLPVAGVLGLLTGSWWVLAPIPVYMSAGVATWVPSRRTERALKAARAAAEREAAVLRTPRVPDAGPDQCPVCAGYGLDALAKDDKLMERGADRAQVVAWGRRRAHWACAEFVPYVPTAADRRLDEIKQWHEEDEFYERQARLVAEESWPFLMSAMKPGWREIRVFHEPTHKHYLLQSADLRHSEILTVESRRRAGDGFGWLVSLTERPVHAFPAETKLVPLEPKRLWNWTESRPYTRTELGLCDCGSAAPGVSLLVDRSFRSRDGLAINPGRVFTGPNGESCVDCTPGDRWMWPDLKGGSK